MENEAGRFTLIFLGVPGDEGGEVELTYNWDESGYGGGRNFGHLAYQVDDIYETCQRLMDNGVTINRPPRDGRMAFVRTPDKISIELLQKGAALGAGRALGVDAEHRPMVGWPDRRFLDLVGTEQPIVQAPMAGAGGVELCVAAIEGGALGSLPCAMLSPEQVREQVAEVRSRATPARSTSTSSATTMPRRCRRQRLARAACGLITTSSESSPATAARCACRSMRRCARSSRSFGRRSSASISACPSEPLLDRVKAAGAVVIGNATTRRGGALARGARRRRDHRAGLRGGRPHRPLPRLRPGRGARPVRAAAAGRRRGVACR